MKTKQDIISPLYLVGMVAPTNNNINYWKEDDSRLTISSNNIQLIFPLWNHSVVTEVYLHI